MSGLAGRLRERVTLLRPTGARDALGGREGGDWTVIDTAWAAIEPETRGPMIVGEAAEAAPVWRVTLRMRDVRVGDRIERLAGAIDVREVRVDPRLPDRIVAIGGERR